MDQLHTWKVVCWQWDTSSGSGRPHKPNAVIWVDQWHEQEEVKKAGITLRLWAGAAVCHKIQTARSDTTHLLRWRPLCCLHRPRLVSSHTFKRDSSITLGTKGPICCKNPLESLTCHLRCVLHRTQRFLGDVPAHSSPHTLSQRPKWNMCTAQSPERESAHLYTVFGNCLWCHTNSVWGVLRDAGKSMHGERRGWALYSLLLNTYSDRTEREKASKTAFWTSVTHEEHSCLPK